ncbi:nuclear transport factor 2 family protein [Granulicella sp. L60]|uniref:nuclear transport factor 2 family protein n=1 Tax=Granulicella sp. L60 TaxID=1641866 RepID=UPI00131BA9A4|nr:nuclear transport factor 2 family protein [Granulicella sp. L60]
MNEVARRELALGFVAGVKAGDRHLLQSITTEDVVWSLPGDNVISGEAYGVDAILERANTLQAFEVNVRLEHVVFGYKDVGLILHNTGTKNGRVLDMHLTTVMLLRDGKIQRLNTLLHDVPMVNTYFNS